MSRIFRDGLPESPGQVAQIAHMLYASWQRFATPHCILPPAPSVFSPYAFSAAARGRLSTTVMLCATLLQFCPQRHPIAAAALLSCFPSSAEDVTPQLFPPPVQRAFRRLRRTEIFHSATTPEKADFYTPRG